MSDAIQTTGIQIMDAVPLREFARSLQPRRSWKTLYAWCIKGRRNRFTKKIVLLEYIQLTTGMATSREAYERFIRNLNTF